MVRPLSEQLSDLSVRAKSAEDAVKAAKTEAHEKVVARREQSRAAVTAAIGKMDQDIKSVATTASKNWAALQAKVAADLETLKARIGGRGGVLNRLCDLGDRAGEIGCPRRHGRAR
jgi:phage host-nuclease inhibitor protein Gam